MTADVTSPTSKLRRSLLTTVVLAATLLACGTGASNPVAAPATTADTAPTATPGPRGNTLRPQGLPDDAGPVVTELGVVWVSFTAGTVYHEGDCTSFTAAAPYVELLGGMEPVQAGTAWQGSCA